MGAIVGIVFLIIVFIGGNIFFKKLNAEYAKQITEIDTKIATLTTKEDRYERERYDERKEVYTKKQASQKQMKTIFSVACCVLIIIILALNLFVVVPTGYTGIKTTFGKVENETLQSGINFKLPWQTVINMDNREQRTAFQLEAFSKDIQQVDIQGSINLNIDKTTAMNLYKDVGVDYPTILVGPRVQEDVKIVIAKYTAENLVENRQKASDEIFSLIKTELAEKGINVISLAIENIDFTDAFESAVEAKQVATQEKQKAQTEQERQTMEMQQQAERDRIKANAEADVKKIDADAKAYAIKVQAEAEAEANKKVAETLSDQLIQYNTVRQWDGKLPTVSSDDAMPIINLGGQE